jgi:hypothetical protein
MSESLFDPRLREGRWHLRRLPKKSLYERFSHVIARWRYNTLDADEALRWGYYQMALFKKNQIGDGPVDPEYLEKMRVLARGIDHHFNGSSSPASPKKIGFILMVFPFGDGEGRCNYMSNAERADVVRMLKEQIRRFETQEAEENDVLFRR